MVLPKAPQRRLAGRQRWQGGLMIVLLQIKTILAFLIKCDT